MQIVTVSLYDLDQLLEQKAQKIIQAISEKEESKNTAVNWLNLTQLCDYLPDKPAKATVYEWVSKKRIPHHKKSKALSFLKSEIDDWLSEGRKLTVQEISREVVSDTDEFLSSQKRAQKSQNKHTSFSKKPQ